MVDLSKIKPGDSVGVRLNVLGVDGDRLRLGRNEAGAWAWANDWELIEHTPKALSAGDQVRLKPPMMPGDERPAGTVKALVGFLCWVEWAWAGGGAHPIHEVRDIAALERIP